jgi:hypothetical protein
MPFRPGVNPPLVGVPADPIDPIGRGSALDRRPHTRKVAMAPVLQTGLGMQIAPRWITVDSRVNDTLARYPSTAPVFIQFGRLYGDRPRELYLVFPGLMVGEYSRYNRIAVEPLLVELNAAAESEEAAWRWFRSRGGDPVPMGDFSLALGYTASYRPTEDAVAARVPAVLVQTSRGPD